MNSTKLKLVYGDRKLVSSCLGCPWMNEGQEEMSGGITKGQRKLGTDGNVYYHNYGDGFTGYSYVLKKLSDGTS